MLQNIIVAFRLLLEKLQIAEIMLGYSENNLFHFVTSQYCREHTHTKCAYANVN